MHHVGPATQTLAALAKISRRETFVQLKEISRVAGVPRNTVTNHFNTLIDSGYVKDRGRELTRYGRLRNTRTRCVTQEARQALSYYSVLPRWACCKAADGRFIPWSARAVLAIIMKRLMHFRAAWGGDADAETLEDSAFFGGEYIRFRLSISDLQRETGMCKQAVRNGKRALECLGVVRSWADEETGSTYIEPNYAAELRVKELLDYGVFEIRTNAPSNSADSTELF